MYEDAMDAIHNHLLQKSMGNKMTYTSELIPEDDENGDLYVPEQGPIIPHHSLTNQRNIEHGGSHQNKITSSVSSEDR